MHPTLDSRFRGNDDLIADKNEKFKNTSKARLSPCPSRPRVHRSASARLRCDIRDERIENQLIVGACGLHFQICLQEHPVDLHKALHAEAVGLEERLTQRVPGQPEPLGRLAR